MSAEELIEQSNRQEVSKFKDSLVRYLRKWPWILVCVIISVLISNFRLKFTANQYKVESTVQVKKSNRVEDPGDLIFGSRYTGRLSGISDEAVIFKSFPLVKSTLKSLQFDVTYQLDDGFIKKEVYKSEPFVFEYNRDEENIPYGVNFKVQLLDGDQFQITTERPYSGKTLNQRGQFGEQIHLGTFSFSIQKTALFEANADFKHLYSVRLNSIDKIAYTYRNRLKFEDIESFSSILTMSMKTSTPQKAIDFINTLIEKYIEQNLIDKNEVAKNTVEFIDQQLAIISDSLNIKEKNLELFKSSEQMSDLSIEGEMLIERFNQIETEKAQYEVMQQYYDYLQTNLEGGDESNLNNLVAPSAFGIQDLIVNDLVKNLLELNLTETKLIQDGSTKSPLLVQVKNRKKELMAALEESINNLSKANRIIISNLDKRIAEVNASAQRLPNTERQLVNLNRLLKLNENIYLFLMEKRSSAAISMSSNTPDCKVIDPAMLNPIGPISPNKRMAYMIAILLGVFLPLMVIVLKDFLNDSISGKEDIESSTQVPILGLIPKGKADGSRFIAKEKPKSMMAESFRILRTNLSFFQKNKLPFVIMVTSTIAREGKTFCAINLASVLAASGKKTILLGFDLRKPRLHKYLGLENLKGISNYLTGNCSLEEIIISTEQENFYVVNSGSIPPNPAELLMQDKTKEFIGELKKEFEYIIIDTPPVGIVADSLILKQESDLNLYVIRQGFSKREYIDRINDLYSTGKISDLSIIINDADKAAKYSSGYYEDDKRRSSNGFLGFLKRG